MLCFWRAYPDDARVLRDVERRLAEFGNRIDLQRVRKQLVGSGIAGTDIVYLFKYLTALWLAERWPDRLRIEWPLVEDEARLTQALITLALPAEVPGLDEAPREGRAWLSALCGDRETDATWLVRRIAALPAPALARDRVLRRPWHLVPAGGWARHAESHDRQARRRADRLPGGADASRAAGPARRDRRSATGGSRRHPQPKRPR